MGRGGSRAAATSKMLDVAAALDPPLTGTYSTQSSIYKQPHYFENVIFTFGFNLFLMMFHILHLKLIEKLSPNIKSISIHIELFIV